MRKLIYAINLTADGCCDHTKGIADGELHEYHTNLLREVDSLLFGRITWQLMVPYWPEVARNQSGETPALNDFAQAFVAVKEIVVVSRSLSRDQGKNTRVVNNDLRSEVLKLKRAEGKDILTGGVDVPSQLIQLGLVDEYRFIVQPVIAGEGRRLLQDTTLPQGRRLKLLDAKPLRSGAVALRYANA
jgi:dihydrofolate reductase